MAAAMPGNGRCAQPSPLTRNGTQMTGPSLRPGRKYPNQLEQNPTTEATRNPFSYTTSLDVTFASSCLWRGYALLSR